MPAYNSGAVNALYPGDSVILWNAEASTAVTKSQQCVLYPDIGTGDCSCLIEGFFSGDPGVFSLALQFADTDAEAYYISPTTGGTISATVGTPTWHFSVKWNPTTGNFLRLVKTSIANAVNVTVKVTR